MQRENNSTNDSWVLGLVGVGASLLAADGQYTIMYSLMGIILFAVVTTVVNVHQYSIKFIRAYSCVLAMCIVLIFASPINATLVSFGIAGHSPIAIGSNGEYYSLENTHVFLTVLWIALTAYIYIKQRNKKLDDETD